MVVIFIQTTNLLWLFGTLQLSVHITMLCAIVRLPQATIGPQLPLATEAMLFPGGISISTPEFWFFTDYSIRPAMISQIPRKGATVTCHSCDGQPTRLNCDFNTRTASRIITIR